MALTADMTIVSIDTISTSLGSYRVQAQVQASENDPNLLPEVFATVNWGDGSTQAVNVGPTNLVASTPTQFVYAPTLSGTIYHDYSSGQFNIRFTASNLRYPTPDTLPVYDLIKLSGEATLAPTSPIIIGPILPADAGFPNAKQWLLNTDTDLRLLASNVKMILITNVGERLMIPNYGTILRQLLFSPNDTNLQGAVLSEVTRAITAWEPRVQVLDASAVVSGNTASVTVSLLSLLSQQSFTVAVQYPSS